MPAVAESVASETVQAIRAYCRAHADPAVVAKYAKYFKEGYDAYGTDWHDPAWQEVQRAAIERLKAAPAGEWLDVCDDLAASGKYEEVFFAIRTATAFKRQFTPAVFERIGRWLEAGIANWAHADTLAGEVLSVFLLKEVVPPEALLAWGASPHKYKRRAVPVTLIKTLKGEPPLALLLDALRPLMADSERVVHQGIGWFLREAWKRQPEPVEAYLLEHRRTAPRLIYQYATEKMPREQRERYRRA